METLIGFVLIVGVLAAPVVCTRWVLGPIDRAGANHRVPVQFSLADLLGLFVVVQLPLGGLHFATRGVTIWRLDLYDEVFAIPLRPIMFLLDVLIVLFAATVWWTLVRRLSRAGIDIAWHRLLTLTVILPVAFVGSIAILVLPLVATASWRSTTPSVSLFCLQTFRSAASSMAPAGSRARSLPQRKPAVAGCRVSPRMGGPRSPHRRPLRSRCLRLLYRLGRSTGTIIVAAKTRRNRTPSLLSSHVLRVNRPSGGDVVGAGDDGAGVGEDG